MLTQIKKHLPQPIKKALGPAYRATIVQWQKKRFYFRMKTKHHNLLNKLKDKECIRVVFLVVHKSVWKVDPVFRIMLNDPFFDPVILVCPYTTFGKERMLEEMEENIDYFLQKKYPVYSSYNQKEERWITLDELSTDIVFFTNPHDLTLNHYYKSAYSNYLSCYVPYFSDMASEYNLNDVYNQFFHNSLWINFIPDEFSKKRALSVLANKGKNIQISGNLTREELLSKTDEKKHFWKKQDSKKLKVIYAAHQSINNNDSINLATFLVVGEFMKSLAIKHKDRIQWSFRPHPILKSKLYEHSNWGKEKTDNYYEFWKNEAYTQLDEGSYFEIFKTSDAMIHDCGSFIIEYLYLQKPCAYIMIDTTKQQKPLNSNAKAALKYYKMLQSKNDIDDFINSICEGNTNLIAGHKEFMDRTSPISHINKTPSRFIIEEIKDRILNQNKL